MANIKLEWLQATYIESFNIYRSDSPMNTASMPAPLTTGITNNYYFDTSITIGETYYYRVGAVRGEQELISSEVEVLAGAPVVNDPQWSNVELLIFADAISFPSTALIDSSSRGRTLATTGSPQIVDTESLYDAGSIYVKAATNDRLGVSSSLGLGTSDFTAECFLKIANDAVSNPFAARIIDLGSIGLLVTNNDSTYRNFFINLGTGATANLTTLGVSAKGRWLHFCLMRKSGVVYAFIDGVLGATIASTASLTSYTYFGGGPTSGRSVQGYLNCCRITKAARYSETGFTVPTEKFPTS